MLNERQLQAAEEINRRENDGLLMIRALETQVPILKSQASELAVVGGNRSSKSFTCAAKVAGIARDLPVHGPKGEPIEQRTPWQKNRPLLIWCVGFGWDHIGSTIWRLLFKAGLYRVIRDHDKKRWRAFNPWLDKGRELECRPSPPLIPMSEVEGGMEGISWENKKERQFSKITLKNGTVIEAYASTGAVKMGDPVDVIWIDETIFRTGHYAEWQARLSDTKGRIIWSSLSDMNTALMRVHKRATEQANEIRQGLRDEADVEAYTLRFSANPHIDDEEKRKRIEGWDEDERKMRDEGEFLIGNVLCFPQFDPSIHCAIYENQDQDDELARILRERNGQPPDNWTRELILDPGTAKPGVLFGAVPPPELWDKDNPYFVVYDEIFGYRIPAGELARRIKAKSSDYRFQRFIIDGIAARYTPLGFSGTVGQNYSKAFLNHNLFCEETGTSFTPGDPNWKQRSISVEEWMTIRPNGRPALRIVTKRCPHLVEQLQSIQKQTQTGPDGNVIILDEKARGQKDDLVDCLTYWASRSPRFVRPPEIKRDLGGPGMRMFKEVQKMFPDRERDDGSVHFGPSARTDEKQREYEFFFN